MSSLVSDQCGDIVLSLINLKLYRRGMDIHGVNEIVLLMHPLLPSGQYVAGRGVVDVERDRILGM